MSEEKTLGEAFGEELRKKHQAMMRDAERFRALAHVFESASGHDIVNLERGKGKIGEPDGAVWFGLFREHEPAMLENTLAELADKLIAEKKEGA